MNNRPGAGDLLRIARETFVARIVPTLPGHLRYTVLMIANAMAIAQREIDAGDAPARAEFERLCTLLGEARAEPGDTHRRTAVAAGNRRLARAIRAGRYDTDNAELLEHLRKTTEEKLAISNPKALKDT